MSELFLISALAFFVYQILISFNLNSYQVIMLNAYEMYHNEITLPLHTRLTDDDVKYVIENLVDVVKSR